MAQQAAAQAAAAQAATAQAARAGLTQPPGSVAAPGVRVRRPGPQPRPCVHECNMIFGMCSLVAVSVLAGRVLAWGQLASCIVSGQQTVQFVLLRAARCIRGTTSRHLNSAATTWFACKEVLHRLQSISPAGSISACETDPKHLIKFYMAAGSRAGAGAAADLLRAARTGVCARNRRRRQHVGRDLRRRGGAVPGRPPRLRWLAQLASRRLWGPGVQVRIVRGGAVYGRPTARLRRLALTAFLAARKPLLADLAVAEGSAHQQYGLAG